MTVAGGLSRHALSYQNKVTGGTMEATTSTSMAQGIMRCVKPVDPRTRCKVLTWQELSCALPRGLREFLRLKYGIVSPALP